ncbi:MAG: tRNA (adenosine(37)-N6)-threonylcarbamoyltransferase complex dimerization subunit type 1 TsaB, partial [Acidobacteria bacterium]|nr:tRNA (adenosine(37)-N6)-threonylcarbamoyltransferase complex dimerization subunit type 1 TsaB [Acidobacteriota bacterium]
HASRLPLAINDALKKASLEIEDINAVGVVIGPGSFTGLRVGISTAIGLKTALNLPVYTFSSLYCLSKFSKLDGKGASLIDARKGEFYCQKFEKRIGKISPVCEPHTIKYSALESCLKNLDWGVILKGGAIFDANFSSKVEVFKNLNLAKIASKESSISLSEGKEGEDRIVPLYVREADAVIQM